MATIGDVLDRWENVLEGSRYGYAASPEPFSFELQPSQTADHVYAMESELKEVDGGLNYLQIELHEVRIWLAEKVQRDAPTTWRALVNGCSSLAGSLARDAIAGGVHADVTAWEVPQPEEDQDTLVAKITAMVDLERSLAPANAFGESEFGQGLG